MKLHPNSPANRALSVLICILTLALPPGGSTVLAAYNCIALQAHPSEDATCTCQSSFGGGDADCPPGRSYHKDPHDICIGGKATGYLVCAQSVFQVGWDKTCEIRLNQAQYTLCLLVYAPACGIICAGGPTPACLACLAAMATQCQGCRIRYCYEYEATPLFCIRPDPGHPHTACP